MSMDYKSVRASILLFCDPSATAADVPAAAVVVTTDMDLGHSAKYRPSVWSRTFASTPATASLYSDVPSMLAEIVGSDRVAWQQKGQSH